MESSRKNNSVVQGASVQQARDASSSADSIAAPSRLHSFIVRAGFGIAYAAIFIACLLLGVVPTAAFVAVMSWFCCFEFYRMMRLDGKVPNEILGLTAASCSPVCAWRVGAAYRYAFHPYLIRGYVVSLFAPHAYRRCCGYHIRSFVYRLHALCHRVDARVYPRPCRCVAIHRYLRFSLGQRFVCLYGWKQVRQTQDGS